MDGIFYGLCWIEDDISRVKLFGLYQCSAMISVIFVINIELKEQFNFMTSFFIKLLHLFSWLDQKKKYYSYCTAISCGNWKSGNSCVILAESVSCMSTA